MYFSTMPPCPWLFLLGWVYSARDQRKGLAEGVEPHGFAEEEVNAALQRLLLGRVGRQAAQGNDGGGWPVVRVLKLANRPGRLEAVHNGHRNVHQDDGKVVGVLGVGVDCLLAVDGHGVLSPKLADKGRQDLAVDVVVVNNQNHVGARG